jgi:uncharacterized protein HemX
VDLPGLKLIEVLLVLGGLVAFVWWQMRELRIDGEKTAAQTREREAREAQEAQQMQQMQPVQEVGPGTQLSDGSAQAEDTRERRP